MGPACCSVDWLCGAVRAPAQAPVLTLIDSPSPHIANVQTTSHPPHCFPLPPSLITLLPLPSSILSKQSTSSPPSYLPLHFLRNMRFSLASTLVVSLAAQATANSWFGSAGAYSGSPGYFMPLIEQRY